MMDSYLAWFLDIFSCGQEDGQDIVSSKASEVRTKFFAGIGFSLQLYKIFFPVSHLKCRFCTILMAMNKLKRNSKWKLVQEIKGPIVERKHYFCYALYAICIVCIQCIICIIH